MSRGGRGGSNATGVRAIANVLGIARHEIGAFTQMRKDPPPLYPPLGRQARELKPTTDLMFMTDLKQELLQRFHESACYQEKRSRRDIARYTDKFRKVRKQSMEPSFSRIPAELNWTSDTNGKRPAKKRKVNEEVVQAKLARLEERERNGAEQEEDVEGEEEEEGGERKPNNDEDDEPLSDDDYLEEDNDYVHNYFDNGEGYGDSDDNLEDDNVY